MRVVVRPRFRLTNDQNDIILRVFGVATTPRRGAGDGRFFSVVGLNYYTTDIDFLLQNWDVITSRLEAAGCRPASTLLGVTRLAFPEWLIEIEATAVR